MTPPNENAVEQEEGGMMTEKELKKTWTMS